MKKEAEKKKGISVGTRRLIAYIVLIFMVFLCLFWFYILFINATRSHGEMTKGFTDVYKRQLLPRRERRFRFSLREKRLCWYHSRQ